MPSAPKASPARPDNTTSTVSTLTPYEKFCATMAGRASLESEESNTDVGSIEAIITAETEEEMWAADERGVLGGRDLAGVVQVVEDIQVKYSNRGGLKSPFVDPASGKGLYLLITSTRYDDPKYTNKRPDLSQGDKFQWNTSAPRLVAKLLWLEANERLHQNVVIEEIELEVGAVLKLHPAPSGYVNQATLSEASESPF